MKPSPNNPGETLLRAKGGVRLMIFAARADPRAEQTSLLSAQHERLRWETRLPWLLHVVEEAFGVADVAYTERDVEYKLAFQAIVGLILERLSTRFSPVRAGRTRAVRCSSPRCSRRRGWECVSIHRGPGAIS